MRDISKLAVVAFCLAAATAFGALVGSSGSGSSAPATTLERIDTTRFRILSSDATGLTAELLFPSPTVEQLNDPAGNVRVHLDKAEPSGEVGAPELPVYRMMIGVPDGAQIVARATIASSRDLGSHRVVPNPDAKVVYEPNGIQRAEPIFHADPTYYRQTAFYPADIAAVTGTAMIRHRRVAQVEVRPVQYQPSSGRLRAFAKVTVRVDFVGGNAAPSRSFGSKTRESAAFTEFFARELVNDNVSSAWQAAPSATMSAPSQQPEAHTVAALKLYINKKGVYRIDGRAVRDYLVDAGVTLDQINPQHLRVTFEGKELPIYVSGEKDRRFDETDYVEFLAARPTTVYSQFSVYRLEIGLRPGLRVAEAEGAPRDSLSTLVPTFRSKLYFEENKNFLLLQHVPPEEISPDDPHGWYEARDHWFWFGVQNGIDKAEAEYQFPLYDTAQSFDLARIDLNMVGGSPVVHDFQVSFNGVKVARRTLNRQDEATVGRSLAPSDLIDAAKGMNTIRLSRLDTNDEPNTDQYHYHFYVNSFSMEYTRLFKAVGDELFFATPPFPNTTLEVRRRRTLEYSIGEFVGDDVAVYEHDDTGFTTRFRNPEISRVPLTPQTRDRLHAIQTSLGERISTPAALYTTRIQMPDTRDAKYVAVSSRGVKTPYRIEYDRPSDLKSPNNAADWIVIYHPRFAEAAQRLADWRRDPQGGGFRAEAVDVFDIYDEFGHGMQSDKAIKAFLTHAFVNWQAPAISHVVILGDGTTDFFQADKVLYPEPPEFMGNIPTHYVWTLYGQSASDHWYSTISGIDPIPDLFVGRLPVETEDQARAVVEKIIAYDRAPPNGSWRRQIISVADDDTTNSGDFIFKQSLNEISQNHTLLGYQTNRIFLEDIIEDVSANPDDYRGRKPAAIARERIVDSLSRGAVIAQYAGHGGRLVWAHEIIFDNPGIRTLQPSDGRFPLMFVLSCNNGFFDAPADPAMSEVLLRLPETGIIGMIAATRLTFGSGNDALNRIIFDDIFQRKVRSFGEIAFNTKTRLMVDQGLSHLEVMQQYSLFGDPASNLQIADLEFRPEVVNRSVEPGGTLRIAGGSVLHSEYIRAEDRKEFTPVTDFTGTVFVTAQFIHRTTGAVIAQLAEAPITNGRYNEISLDVPATARSGRAQVELFAQTRESLAVGGSTFAVSEPVVEDLDVRVVGSNLAVSAQVTDDLQIASVELEWYDGSQQTWQVSPLVRDTSRGAGWYSLQATIPEPEIGESFEYLIRVIDGDGNKVETTTFRLTPNPLPDWRIQVGEQDRRPLIDYAYDPTDGWRVVVQVENTNRDAKTDIPLKLNLYLGNPDLDRNDEPDADAELLGAATVLPSDWTRGDPLGENPDPSSRLRRSDTPLSTTWSAKAVIPLTLEPGRYLLYAWIDPSTVATRDETRETRFTNNLSTGRLIHIAQTLVPNNGGSLRSLDNGLRIDLPNGALPTARVVEVTTLGALPTGQASVTALPALGSSGAYQVSAGEETFGSPAAVELRFDLTTFRRALQIEAGMGDSPYDALSNEQKAILQELARGELASAGLYQWKSESERWRKLTDARLLTDAQQNLVTQFELTEPTAPKLTTDPASISIDDVTTPGEYVAFFQNGSQYDLYYRSVGENPLTLVAEAQSVGSGGSQSGLPSVERRNGDAIWTYGDIIRFMVVRTIADEVVIQSAMLGNRTDGVVYALRGDTSGSLGEDVFHILFVNDGEFIVRRRSSGVVTQNGQPLIGRMGELWRDPASGVSFQVLADTRVMSAGDSIAFESREVGLLRGTTSSSGVFAAFQSADTTPPIVEVNVAGQDWADGDPVSPTPEIRVLLADDSGIVAEDALLEVSHNGSDFLAVPADERRAHTTPGTGQLLVNYTPELEAGDYILRTTAYDLDGHRTIKEVSYLVTDNSQLRSVLNYPNPFRSHTDIAIEATGEMESLDIVIYSLAGRVVRKLEHPPTAGFVRVRWDGRDSKGRDVANGVYYGKVTMTARGTTQTQVVKLLRLQ